jgi:TRAP-type transport system small permease protein
VSYLIRLKFYFEKISRGLDSFTKGICVTLVFIMTIEVLTAVFFRYVLNSPLKWGEELARLIMVWAGLLGIAVALKDGEHIGLEMLIRRLRGRALYGVKLVINSMIFIFLLVLFIWGIEICRQAWHSFMPGLQISWTWSHLAVPATAAIQMVHVFAWLIEQSIKVVRCEEEPLSE